MSESEVPQENSPTPPATNPLAVDLSDLRMMPAWVAGMGSSSQPLERFEEREERSSRRGDFRPRGPGAPDRRAAPGGPRRDGPPKRRDDGPPGAKTGGGFRKERDENKSGPGEKRRFQDRRNEGQRPQREWVELPRDLKITIEPEDKAAEALAAHIRTSGHAFSMFDAARLVLAEGDRFHARFTCPTERANGLFFTSDGGLYLSREEALQHLLRSRALEQFYRVDEIELEEPKGDFKSIGVCGISGELLGPPSHHSFQTCIIRLHRERFGHMPLEDYKRRIRVESTPEIVAQWKEKQKKGMRWTWLHDQPAEGAEPLSFQSRAEVEAHFKKLHADQAVREVREAIVLGQVEKSKISQPLGILLRQAVEAARKHLFDMCQKLGSSFERRGLKLFKRRAGKLYVSRIKPRAIDPGVVLAERVNRILEALKSKAGIPLHDLVEAISPSAPATATPEATDAEPSPAPAAKAPPTEEQIQVIKDIRWLANEGYVIEYSDGMVFLGVQGEPQPQKASAPDARTKGEAEATAEPSSVESSPPAAQEDEASSQPYEASVEEAQSPSGDLIASTTEGSDAAVASDHNETDTSASDPQV